MKKLHDNTQINYFQLIPLKKKKKTKKKRYDKFLKRSGSLYSEVGHKKDPDPFLSRPDPGSGSTK